MIDLTTIDRFRDPEWEARIAKIRGQNRWPRDCGAFKVPSPVDGHDLRCMVSAGRLDPSVPWDHVSVSREERCPTWDEMDYIARLFFRPDEAAMQLHVPHTDHVDFHPFCLHIWRPSGLKRIPLPPSILVGPSSAKKGSHK